MNKISLIFRVKLLRVLIGLISTFLLVVGALPIRATATSASQTIQDYWFIETIVVGEGMLPKGVEILTYNPSSEPRRSLILKNQTETLLFVMSLGYKDVLVMATPDPGWIARVNGAQEAASYLVAPNRPASLSIEALTDLDPNLTDRNILAYDPPPENTTIPAAQSSELLLVYGKQVIVVSFSITYALNTGFDNGSEAFQAKNANQQGTDQASTIATQVASSKTARFRNNTIVLSLAVMAILLAGGWVAWRLLRRGG